MVPAMASPHYSRGFVTKPPRRQARRARGAVGTGSVVCGGACPDPERGRHRKGRSYVDRPSGEPARRQAYRSGVSAVAVEAFVNYAG